MSRQMQHRLQKFVSQFFPVARERLHQAPIRARIAGKLVGRKIDISMQAGRQIVIERMGQRDVRLNPFESDSFQRKRFEKRRASRERMNRRTDIMQKSGQC
jgi:hypothetical protein